MITRERWQRLDPEMRRWALSRMTDAEVDTLIGDPPDADGDPLDLFPHRALVTEVERLRASIARDFGQVVSGDG